LRAGSRKSATQKNKPFIVQDQYVPLITCYLLRCRETAGEEVHGRKVENSSQHNTCRLATRGRKLRAGQLYVCLGTNLGWSSPRSVFSWAHGAMSHSVLRTGGARCARVAAPNSGTTARVYDLKKRGRPFGRCFVLRCSYRERVQSRSSDLQTVNPLILKLKHFEAGRRAI